MHVTIIPNLHLKPVLMLFCTALNDKASLSTYK